METDVRQPGAAFHHLTDSDEEKSLPDPSRSLRMYSSELSSKASSSAPAQTPSAPQQERTNLLTRATDSLLNSMLGTITFSQMLVSVFWSSNRCL